MIASIFAFIRKRPNLWIRLPSTVGIILRVAHYRDIAPAKPELSQLMLQRLPVHVQDFSRARDVSLSVLQTAADITALKLTPVLTKISRERHSQAVGFGITALDNAVLRDPRDDLVRQIFWSDLVAIGHDHGAVDRVLQLTHITRPVILHQAP